LLIERPEELAKPITGQATTIDELDGVLKALMKSTLDQLLGAELQARQTERQAAIVLAFNLP